MTAKRQAARNRSKSSPESRAQNPIAERVKIHRQVAKKSLLRLLKTPGSTLMTVGVIAIALLLPTLLLLADANMSAGLGGIESSAKLTLYMDTAATDREIEDVSNHLLSVFGPDSVDFISAEQALGAFTNNQGLGDLFVDLPSNPLPAAFEISPSSPEVSIIEAQATELEALPGVALLQFDRLWIERLQAFLGLIAAFNQVLAVLVVGGLLAVVGNTIRLAIEHRRQEIQVIKLVGGNNSYIARPFLYTGLFLGLAGGIAASMLVWLIASLLTPSIAEVSSLYGGTWQLEGAGLGMFLGLALVGGLIGWLAAFVASFRNIAAINP